MFAFGSRVSCGHHYKAPSGGGSGKAGAGKRQNTETGHLPEVRALANRLQHSSCIENPKAGNDAGAVPEKHGGKRR
jgi:hypothetical protein